MSRTLLATVAAAALVAGTIAVSAQGTKDGSPGAAGGAGGAPSTAPAEKMGPPVGGGTTGQGTGSQQMDRGTSGQTQMDRGSSGQSQKSEPAQPRTGQGQTSPSDRQTGQGQTGTQQQTGQGQTGTSSATLSTEQRTRIRETVLRGGSVNRVSNVNFNIRVGTVVPRSVHLVAVPAAIVEVHPAWRGFLYFVVNDEIIIVEPDTLRIVAVIT